MQVDREEAVADLRADLLPERDHHDRLGRRRLDRGEARGRVDVGGAFDREAERLGGCGDGVRRRLQAAARGPIRRGRDEPHVELATRLHQCTEGRHAEGAEPRKTIRIGRPSAINASRSVRSRFEFLDRPAIRQAIDRPHAVEDQHPVEVIHLVLPDAGGEAV